ncbi:hypothetical protein SteCoe_4946 [Stentor coeruleus]|uniref:EF-hand domain-containing protein n=1 Tax=Stentor coeruleus TaxID=5963 RepID=A0A1R2CTF6_9CILI|nr:hypothetical protein SteCoe_4946 [Stentor coeruleus]
MQVLKYPRNHRTFSSNGDYVDQDTSIQSNPKPNYSFIIRTKSTGKTKRSPGLSLKLKNVHNTKSRFSKIMPKKYSFDHEKLSDDHWASRLKVSIFEEENSKLKNRLAELTQIQEIESNKEAPKMKKKIRKLQNKLISFEDEYLTLKSNIKSSKITEYEKQIQDSLEEAKRLMYLLGKITSENPSMHFGEFEGHKSQISNELQLLRKENLHLNRLTTQALHDLDILKTKLSTLENHKQKKILKAKISKLKVQKLEVQKISDKQTEDFSIIKNDLTSKIFSQKEINNNKLYELDLNERRLIHQDKIINEMKQKLEMFKLASKAKRTQTFMSLKIREEVFTKLMNPPRLLVKIDQVLRKKKMIIAVFLSLIDKNNSGLMHTNAFIAGMKTYGLKIKQRHIKEISKLLGSDFTYIPLRKIEEMFDKYKYDNAYKSSSSEDEEPKGLKNRKNHVVAPVVMIPSEIKKEEAKPLPSPIKIIEKTLTVVSAYELTEILDEIKEKMYLSKLPKNKLVTALFGYDFDPDEGINIGALMDFLAKSHLNLKNEHNNWMLARFLLETEGLKTIKESEILKLKGTIRDFNRKLARILPDWEVFSDSEIDTFRNILNDQMMKNYKRILKAIEDIDKAQEKKIEFIRFQNLLRNLDINFSERMNFWIMMELGIKVKQDKFEYSSFLKKFDESEQNLNVKDNGFGKMNRSPRDSRGLIIIESLKSLVNRLNHTRNTCFFKVNDILTAEEFTSLLYKIDTVMPPNTVNAFINEFSVQKNVKSKEIDMKSFSRKLKEAGLEDFANEKMEIEKNDEDGRKNKAQNQVGEKEIEINDKKDDENIIENYMEKNEVKENEDKNEIMENQNKYDIEKNKDKNKENDEDVKKNDDVDVEKVIKKDENINDGKKDGNNEERKKDGNNEEDIKEENENYSVNDFEKDLENSYEKKMNQDLSGGVEKEVEKDIEKDMEKKLKKENEIACEDKKDYEVKEENNYEEDFYNEKEEENDYKEDFYNEKEEENDYKEDFYNEEEENDYKEDFYNEKIEENTFEEKNDLIQEVHENPKDLKEATNHKEEHKNDLWEKTEIHEPQIKKILSNEKPKLSKIYKSDDFSEEPEELSEIHDKNHQFSPKPLKNSPKSPISIPFSPHISESRFSTSSPDPHPHISLMQEPDEDIQPDSDIDNYDEKNEEHYSNSFASNKNNEKIMQHHTKNVTELEFVEYGIALGK